MSTSKSNEEELRQKLEKDLAGYPAILRNEHLCEILTISPGTRNRWQFEGKLPPRLPAVGQIVRYAKSDLIEWWVRKLQKSRPRGRPTNAERAKRLAELEARP